MGVIITALRKNWLIIGLLMLLAAYFIAAHFNAPLVTKPIIHTVIILSAGYAITLILFWLLILLFGSANFKKGFLNFLIGEDGTYSLSRLQAVIWALIIIAHQLSLAVSLINNTHGNYFYIYEPVLSETSVWLIGLSLSSYVMVKGITVSNIQQNPAKYIRNNKPASWKDLLVGDNGLDFSRCQILIWTLIALIVYSSKCYYFLEYTSSKESGDIIKIFSHTYELNSEGKAIGDASLPFVPFLPWTFIVLMGLSQGAYVGKKLVPSFKLDDLKTDKKVQINNKLNELKVQQTLLGQMTSLPGGATLSGLNAKNAEGINNRIAKLQQQIAELNGDVNQIDNALKLT